MNKSGTSNKPKKTHVTKPQICCLILIVIATLAILGTYIYGLVRNEQNRQDSMNANSSTDADEDAKDYYSLLTPIDSQAVLDFMSEKSSGLMYIGRPTCPVCQTFVPMLGEVLLEQDVAVFYYDTEEANNDSDKKSAALNAVNVTSVPTFIYIQNGEIVDELEDVTSKSAIKAFIDKNN